MLHAYPRRALSALGVCLALALVIAPTSDAQAGSDPAKGIPSDVFVYSGWMHNPERDYMADYKAAVWNELKASGIFKDVQNFFMDMMPPAERGQIDGSMKMVQGLLEGVDWAALVEGDGAWGMSMGPMGPLSVNVFTVNPDKMPAIVERMGKIFDTAAQMGQGFVSRINETKEGGPTVHGLQFQGVPYGFFITTHGEHFIFTNERSLLDRSLAGLASENGEGSVHANAKFRSALQMLPQAEDTVSFFDASSMSQSIFGMVSSQMPPIPQAPEGASEQDKARIEAQAQEMRRIQDLMNTMRTEMDLVDYTASVGYTEGFRNLTASYTQYKPEAEQKTFYKLTANQPQFDDFKKFIPADATSFALSSGINIAGLYDWAMAFVKSYVPNGAEQIAQWDAMQKEVIGMNIRDELLANIVGDTIRVSFPSATPNPFGGASDANVTMCGIRNGEKLGAMFANFAKQGSKMAAERGLPISLREVNVVEGGSFLSLTFAMAPFVQPVIGVAGDRFIFASDAGAVKRILDLPKHPENNITKNPRYAALGLIPDMPVSSISYRDLEKQYQGTAQALQGMGMMISMMSGMMAAQMPAGNEQQREQMMKVITKVTEILPKLAPVVAKIDYYQDQTTYTYRNAASRAVITKSVTSIKPPKKKAPAEGTPEKPL